MRKELKFIHITKTGGTSIEECAKKKGVLFGMYDKSYQIQNIARPHPWHTIFRLFAKEYKTKYDWFTVVRNPYDRIISEYYCKWGGIGRFNYIEHTKEEFNLYIKQEIVSRSQNGCHYLEQCLYIEDDPDVKIHILKFENLKEEFENLMKMYNIDLVLDEHCNVYENKKFMITDLSNEVISLINNVYKKDFEMFGYEMRNIDSCLYQTENTIL